MRKTGVARRTFDLVAWVAIVWLMFGGIAVSGNLLCVSHTDVRGNVFLVDLEDLRVASRWSYAGPDGGYADAGGIAMDAAYNIFVADTANDVVRRFTAFGREIERLGVTPERGAGSRARDRRGVFDRPVAVAVLGDTLFVACGERRLVRGVHRVDVPSGQIQQHLRSCGDSEGRFGAPRGISVDAEGIWVADTLHGVIQRFRPDGRFVNEIPVARRHDAAARPVAVVSLGGGDLLVADQGDTKGLVRVGHDGGPRDVVVEGCPLDEPTGLARDASGAVYVLDRHGERVQRLTPELAFDEMIVDLAEVGGELGGE